MEASASTAGRVSEQVLAHLVKRLDVDASFLRHNDHDIRASILVAEWPRRPALPDVDPLAAVPFTTADPVLALCEDGRKPTVMRLDQETLTYQHQVAGSRGVASSTIACAPLISAQMTTGMLGFIKFGRKKWKPEEINALEVIASLFAQLQARIAAEEKLHYLADHDDLTGLHNRRALVAHLSRRLANRGNGPVAVLYLDLDRLKAINDCFGHTAGDWSIRVLAERLRQNTGSDSLVARIGGDEFVIVPDRAMTSDNAEALARQLHPMLCGRLAIGGDMVTVTVSIGVAVGVAGSDDWTDLLGRADEAVLTAKRDGGNQVAVASGHISFETALRNDIELYLQGDIDSDELVVNYLPEVDLWSGAIVAVEALGRWHHPKYGVLLPDSFIGAVESMDLAKDLGQWVMRSACTEFSRWRSNGVGHNVILRINVSPAQLLARGFARSVADVIEEFGIDSGSVCLEITERAMWRDIETTRRTLSELKEVGVRIAIDDFRTGYAVLSDLKSLPIDVLKIGKSFVHDLGSSPSDLKIIRAIIGLAEAFGLELVAEGLETPAAALTLMRHGCHRAQGYLLSRPLGSKATESLLTTGRMPMPFLADSDALALGRDLAWPATSPARVSSCVEIQPCAT
ncbi:putative bifunctional diguanylate cyclase/phosphodiesterase [Mycobacterium sp.]|uniref:putative bifunctional diguanylate cyclase/phosphodiesterase n=1 Tax=Mycobacterium sp. TaxID=1785 RepID=UPI003D6B7B6C